MYAYVGSLGIPFPITLVIIAAGAFARAGLIDWRLAGDWLKRRFYQQTVWQHALSTINCQGGWAILLTRFWLMPLAPCIQEINHPVPRKRYDQNRSGAVAPNGD